MNAILGINFGHDGSAAVVVNGVLKSAIGRERITRVKKDGRVCEKTINYVLEVAGIDLNDITAVAFSSYFYQPEDHAQGSYIRFFDVQGNPVKSNLVHLVGGKCFDEYRVAIGDQVKPAILVQHHMAHAASAFYTSPFERAACFSLDASGVHPEFCSLFAIGAYKELKYFYCPGIMAGNVYSVFTSQLGIGPGLTKAGTTMALAAFGEIQEYANDWANDFASWYKRPFQNSDAVHTQYLWTKWTGKSPHENFPPMKDPDTEVKNHAASLQYMFERCLVSWTNRLYEETRSFNDDNLVLAGGSFLNSDVNMRLKQETPFKRIHLFPACGDDGTAAGAALYLSHSLMGQPRHKYKPSDYMYLGKDYTPMNKQQDELDYDSLAKDISKGKIVAWFQGRSEFGPRALGNRSFLADPRSLEMKDRINLKVKHREWFRPFAPAVLEEEKSEWFDIDFESKLMLFITRILKPELIPAVAHIDNSARVQTVSESDNPRFYKLIKSFGKLTNVPVLLNTSLNDNNEPLVETPEDARRLFERTDIEILVIGDQVIRKSS
ncbi:MAG TPA: carbamoyltransferase C-terminal domain-containing protein [Oligoflexia bacterium]|nr:carbamoyltransferase C-terminal domain-containing protein [Oligoflexia bacterium]HMP48969.1 carbamoyltransferase C-terminal domain-containing protein [Oligoflexia bacterium]